MTCPDPDRHDAPQDHQPEKHDAPEEERTEAEPERDDAGGQVSEGGSGALNQETAQGGADAVPGTPDVNNPGRPIK
ncbi:MAG: hypothetical protein M3424_01815 [Actinomycetota bacterium]|nr:hypothetical protein [Actinomycetota bacterium]MDQ3526627.1 hypothetical protein [Actinomycetota bacterium]